MLKTVGISPGCALCHSGYRPLLEVVMVLAAAPSCSIPLRVLQLSVSLRRRLEQLQLKLSHQVETLPLGNESWLQTERELVAAEKALHSLVSAEP